MRLRADAVFAMKSLRSDKVGQKAVGKGKAGCAGRRTFYEITRIKSSMTGLLQGSTWMVALPALL